MMSKFCPEPYQPKTKMHWSDNAYSMMGKEGIPVKSSLRQTQSSIPGIFWGGVTNVEAMASLLPIGCQKPKNKKVAM